jgi:beta-galactosidase/beta-glucuronidase
VEIVRRPAGADLLDFKVQADANGHFECGVEYRRRSCTRRMVARIYSDKQLSANGDMWEPGECIWEKRRLINTDDGIETSRGSNGAIGKIHFADTLSGTQPWSAELPNLYTLTISLYDVVGVTEDEGRKEICRQSESCRIGFRTIDIVAPGVVTINGQRVRAFAGINRHEHDPDHGKVVSLERMQQDLCLLKYVVLPDVA